MQGKIPQSSFFITGFPGFIATYLVEKLAMLSSDNSASKFFLLVQQQFANAAEKTIKEISVKTGVDAERFEIIVGDITVSGLGLPVQTLSKLQNEVSDVFHLAAIYDLAVEREPAYRVNVEGTQNVNNFVRTIKNLRRYHYISTCYVAGKREGRIFETELVHSAGFRNFYEETKYLAELEVERLKAQLPLTIYRPSVVVGHSVKGKTPKYDGIYYLIKYLMRAPKLIGLVNVGNYEVRLNLVPVDFVIEALAALAFDQNAEGKTLALADPQPLYTAELFKVIARTLGANRQLLMPPPSFTHFFLDLPVSPMLTGLPKVGVPYFFIKQEYDTAISSNLLKARDIKCPGFADYAANLIEFVRRNPDL